MHVAGSHNRDIQLFAQRHDAAVEIAQLLFIAGGAVANHELVVANGLDLEIVVPAGDFLQFRVGAVVHDGLEQFARLARAAKDQALAVFVDQVAGLLDEIDAALDDRNVERFASYLHNLSKNTQFIVITHRRGTMEASDVLYGVTMQEQGVSKLLRLDLNQMEQYLGIVE